MLKKRIIPCLDVDNGQVVKGVQFQDLRSVGDPLALAKRYEEEGADELVFLDVSATNEERSTAIELAGKLATVLSIPFTIGGGIRNVEQARSMIQQGADKIAVSSAAVQNPGLLRELSTSLGNQAVVLSIDAKKVGKNWCVTTHGGKQLTALRVGEWAKAAEIMGAGEILLNSIDHDGAKNGFDLALLQEVAKACQLPIIASGGASKREDFLEVFQKTRATGALAASIFHYGEISIPDLKEFLHQKKIPIRC